MRQAREILANAKLLGGFDFRSADGAVLVPRGRKTRGVLATALLARGRPVARSRLIDLFWHDRGVDQGRASLRQALRELRMQAGKLDRALYTVDRESLTLASALVATDLWDAEGNLTPDFRGELLLGLDPVAPVFDDWLEQERRVVAKEQLGQCERMLENASASPEEALVWAERVLQFDPCHEAAACAAMRAHSSFGATTQVVRVFNEITEALRTTGFPMADGTRDCFARLKEARSGNSGAASGHATTAIVPVIEIWPVEARNSDDQKELCNCMTEELVARFAEMPEIMALSHENAHSAATAKNSGDGAAPAPRATYELRGAITALGDTTRCNLGLMHINSRTAIWSVRKQIPRDVFIRNLSPLCDDAAASLLSSLERAEFEKARLVPKHAHNAYHHYLRAKHIFFAADTPDYMSRAESHLTKAIELDPGFAPAYVHLIQSLNTGRVFSQPGTEIAPLRKRALELADRLLKINARNANAHIAWAWCMLWQRQFDRAERSIRSAIDLNPYESHRLNSIGTSLLYLGHRKEAERYYQQAQSTLSQDLDFLRTDFGELYYFEKVFDQALSYLDFGENRVSVRNKFWRSLTLAQCGAMSEARQEAEGFVADMRRHWASPDPFLPVRAVQWMLELLPLRQQEDMDLVLDGLTKLGFQV